MCKIYRCTKAAKAGYGDVEAAKAGHRSVWPKPDTRDAQKQTAPDTVQDDMRKGDRNDLHSYI